MQVNWTPHYAIASLIIAEGAAVGSEWYQPLVSAGALGVVTLWFMLRGEKKLDEQTRAQREMTAEMARSQREMAAALTLNSKSNLIVVLALKNQDSNITDIAKQLEAEIEKTEAASNNRH